MSLMSKVYKREIQNIVFHLKEVCFTFYDDIHKDTYKHIINLEDENIVAWDYFPTGIESYRFFVVTRDKNNNNERYHKYNFRLATLGDSNNV